MKRLQPMFTQVWAWLHPVQLANFKERAQIDCILRDGLGRDWTVVSRGRMAVHIHSAVPLSVMVTPFGVAEVHACQQVGWNAAARFFEIARTPGDSLAEAMAGGQLEN